MSWQIIQVGDVVIRFYSISDELDLIKDYLLQFVINMSPQLLALVIILTISTIVVLFVWSVYIAIRDFSSFEKTQEETNKQNV